MASTRNDWFQRPQVFEHFGPADREQGPHERHSFAQPPQAANARQAGQACAAQNMVQHGLGLVVAGVGRGQPTGAGLLGRLAQEGVPLIPQGRFRRGGGDVGRSLRASPDHATHPERPAEIFYERLVGVGVLAAEPMVEMAHDQPRRLTGQGPQGP